MRSSIRAHPRVGGENTCPRTLRLTVDGSSPRGRGKRKRCRAIRHEGRLIPAWAGKTSTRRTRTSGRAGSSPRGRGKRRPVPRPRPGCGLIPAWAGKTCPACSPPRGRRAHPRVGGENDETQEDFKPHNGSSPRGRGKRNFLGAPCGYLGLIPAWAGKTCSTGACLVGVWAHPRVGGENWEGCHASPRASGSSPRGRGKRVVAVVNTKGGGLIPAWAGKTSSGKWRRIFFQAHPRVGGENAHHSP